jgi:protein arginine N-methyltransferase 1
MSRGHFIGLNHHRIMLADQTRMDAYARAIAEVVRPGDVVVDVGTGTGVLAMWAAQAGARRVYAIEPHEIIQVARSVAADNGLENIVFLQADSREVTLPEPADVVLTECMGNFFVTDEMQPVVRDMVRFLRPGGRLMPTGITLWLAPVFVPQWREVSFFAEPVGGLDFSAALEFASNHAYVVHVEPELLLGPAVRWQQFALAEAPDVIRGPVILPIQRAATLHGFAGWFTAALSPSVDLDTGPGTRTHWGQMLFPVDPVSVRPGDSVALDLDLAMDPRYRHVFAWHGEVLREGKVVAAFDKSTARRFG